MHEQGMIIGSHTENHPVMSKLCYEAQLKEIRGSFASLDEIINSNFKTYCHPYGAHYDFNINTIDLLNKLNIDYSFMVDLERLPKKTLNFRDKIFRDMIVINLSMVKSLNKEITNKSILE